MGINAIPQGTFLVFVIASILSPAECQESSIFSTSMRLQEKGKKKSIHFLMKDCRLAFISLSYTDQIHFMSIRVSSVTPVSLKAIT